MARLRRIAQWVGIVLAVLIASIAGYFYGMNPKSRPAPDVKASTSPEVVERGRYLAANVLQCMWCHSTVDATAPGQPVLPGLLGAGRNLALENPAIAKVSLHLGTPNLTPDPRVGLGSWTDGEIVRAMREGVDKTGRPLAPMMPYDRFARVVTDADALAIVAYLRSLKPVDKDPGPFVLPFPLSMLMRSKPRPLEHPLAAVPSDPKGYDDWILEAAMCSYCHDTFDERHRPVPGRRLGGGETFETPKGTFVAPNISSDPSAGIGGYTDEQILRVLDEGVARSGRKLEVMPWTAYRGLSDSDKRALVRALRAVPPVH